jgi:hypothetical protein
MNAVDGGLGARRLGVLNAPRPSWDDLVAAEPRLAYLMRRVSTPVAAGGWSQAWAQIWTGEGGVRTELQNLVGWWADGENPILHGSAAYEIAVSVLYEKFNDVQPGEIETETEDEP